MRPDKQSEYDHVPGIYRELSRELRLPEQRIREMEQKIRQKAAEKESPSVVVYSGGKARRTVRRLAYALAPVAACAVIALTCVIAYKTGMLKPSEYQTAESEPEFAEQTGVYLQTGLTTDANEQTDTVTEAVTVYTPVSGTGAGTLTAVPDVTEAPQDAGQSQKQAHVEETMEAIRDRFGDGSIRLGYWRDTGIGLGGHRRGGGKTEKDT